MFLVLRVRYLVMMSRWAGEGGGEESESVSIVAYDIQI